MIDVPIRVKDALRDGRRLKNYRFIVLDDGGDEDFTIDNNNLVAESVMIDERLCSGDDLKFGLCEGSSLEFQYFGYPLITGRQIQAFIDVEYVSGTGLLTWFPIPMGFFTVDKCSRQASTGIIKVTAFNKLMSKYLDAKANSILLEDFDGDESTQLTLFDIQRNLLRNYAIVERPNAALPMADDPYMPYDTSRSLKFSSLYNINSPISALNYKEKTSRTPTLDTQITLYLNTYAMEVHTEASHCWDIRFFKGKIDEFVKNFAEKAAKLIADAKLLTTSSKEFDYEDAYNWIMSSPSVGVLIDTTYYDLMTNGDEKLAEIDKIIHHNEATTIWIILPQNLCFYLLHDRYEIVDWRKKNNYLYWRIYDGELFEIGDSYNANIKFSNGEKFDTSVEISDIFAVTTYELSDAELIPFTIGDMPEFTLRDIVSANYETQCQCGQLDRETDLFGGVELNQSKLYPQETLYPATNLYPGGSHLSGFKSMYSKLWADEGNVHKWRYLIITYKGLNTQDEEVERTLQRTVFEDGTENYNCSDNWLFRNLIWAEEDIAAFADAMVAKMREITWFPFEMWAAGLPYVETGDEIEITVGENTYTSYILQRSLKGIQNLQDTYINGTLDVF